MGGHRLRRRLHKLFKVEPGDQDDQPGEYEFSLYDAAA
jgi:hypothetical protein